MTMAPSPWATHPHQSAAGTINRPVVVRVQICNWQILEYNESNAKATISFHVLHSWVDPRLVGWDEQAALPPDLWVPEIASMNAWMGGTCTSFSGPWSTHLGASLGFTQGGNATGSVTLRRTCHETFDCGATADVRDFPTDSHDLRVGLMLGATVAGSTKFCVLDGGSIELLKDWEPSGTDAAGGDGRLSVALHVPQPGSWKGGSFTLPQSDEWRTVAVLWGFGKHHSTHSGLTYHDIFIRFHRKRIAFYYLHKGMYPTAICAMLSVSALLVESELLAERFGILITLFLTLFALQWSTADRLPKTPFLTSLDKCINSAVGFICFICLFSMAQKGAQRIGQSSCYSYGLASAETMGTADAVALGVLCLTLLLGAVRFLAPIRRHERALKSTEAYTSFDPSLPVILSAHRFVNGKTRARRWHGWTGEALKSLVDEAWAAPVAYDGTVGQPCRLLGEVERESRALRWDAAPPPPDEKSVVVRLEEEAGHQPQPQSNLGLSSLSRRVAPQPQQPTS